jgi:class 3 adenylate cyclase
MTPKGAVERKIVSILFADLVGFTSLSEKLDPEDVRTVQGVYFTTVRETIERYDGYLEKFIGDAAMAVFGVPRTREDDAERAVRAGLALAAAVEQLAPRIGLESGALAVRVGINSGEVVHTSDARPEEAIVTGDPINVAARFQAAAAPGEVLVGETTALAAAAAIEFAEARTFKLKGKAEPTLARRARSVRPQRSRDAAIGALRAPLLGRESEIADLLGEIERAQRESGRLLIVAPPGVGKTRLVDELAARAHDVTIAHARLRPDLLAPFEPVAQLFLSAGAVDESALRDRFGAAGIPPARALVLIEEALAVLRPAGDGAVHPDRESRFAAWLQALDALAGDCTGVWLVEDVHWAGADLLAFLAFAGEMPGRRLVLTTSRPSLLETAAEWCAGASSLELAPLATAAASELVRALIGDALPDELVNRIAERSDGNPLFIEELLRTWISVGTLVEKGGVWTLEHGAGDVPLPPTVQAIYAAQLDDLPPAARDVARRASVAGRRFPFAALDRLEAIDARQGVEVLARRALVAGPSPDPLFGSSYAYRHALLRDASYASLARGERARLHVRLAGWLEDAAGPTREQVAEPIARHYARALESVPALAREVAPGLGREGCRSLAAAWFEHAADAALNLAAHESARELLTRALELTAGEETVERARRLTSLGEVTASSADMDKGAQLLDEALELARSTRDRQGIARAAAALSWVLDQQVQFIPALRIADAALAEVGPGDDGETAVLLVRRATAMSNGSDAVDEPRANAERALKIARAREDRHLELEALDLLMSLRRGDPNEWRELEELAVETGAWDLAVDAIQERALRLAPDHASEARPVATRAVDLAETRGLRENLAWGHYVCVEIGLVSGDWDTAVEQARRALAIGIPNGYDRPVLRTWSTVLPIAAARADEELLRDGYEWLTRRFREPERPSPYSRVMNAARHLYLASRGVREAFVPDVEERLACFDLRYSSPSWLAALEIVLDSWLMEGELDGADRALAHMEDSAAKSEVPTLGRSAYSFLRAKLRVANGEDASTEAQVALSGFRKSDAAWWIAKALRLLASPEEVAEAVEIERALGISE